MNCAQIDPPILETDTEQEMVRVSFSDGKNTCSLLLTPTQAATLTLGNSYNVTVGI
jgi:hypothetical protein